MSSVQDLPCHRSLIWPGAVCIDMMHALEYNIFAAVFAVDVWMQDKAAKSFETPCGYAGRFLREYDGTYIYCRRTNCREENGNEFKAQNSKEQNSRIHRSCFAAARGDRLPCFCIHREPSGSASDPHAAGVCR